MNFDLFGVGLRSRSAIMTAQRRVNAYYEINPDEDGRGFKICVFGTPGLTEFVDFGDTPARLLYPKGDLLYVVHRGTFWEVNNAGTKTSRGSLSTTTGRCFAADNGTQIMITDDAGNGYIYTIATTTLTAISDGDYPGATGVTWQDGFFIVTKPDSGRWYISASYDGTSWGSSDFKNAESQPDDNVLPLADHGTVMIFGSLTTEFYSNTGASGFPFSRIQGANLEWGLAAPSSLAKYENSVMGLMRNENGRVAVGRLEGYDVVPVSDSDLESIIRGYGTFADATAFAYNLDGHPFYQISFPTGNQTWLYDGKISALLGHPVWSELTSGTGPIERHRAQYAAFFLNQTIVSDYENGKLYRIAPDVYADNGMPIRRLLVSKHLCNEGLPLTIDELRLFFETGVGLTSGQGVDPQLMLRYSKDGGKTWSPERWADLGAIGDYVRVVFREFGQAEDFVFEIAVTDPVKFALVGEAIEAERHAWA